MWPCAHLSILTRMLNMKLRRGKQQKSPLMKLHQQHQCWMLQKLLLNMGRRELKKILQQNLQTCQVCWCRFQIAGRDISGWWQWSRWTCTKDAKACKGGEQGAFATGDQHRSQFVRARGSACEIFFSCRWTGWVGRIWFEFSSQWFLWHWWSSRWRHVQAAHFSIQQVWTRGCWRWVETSGCNFRQCRNQAADRYAGAYQRSRHATRCKGVVNTFCENVAWKAWQGWTTDMAQKVTFCCTWVCMDGKWEGLPFLPGKQLNSGQIASSDVFGDATALWRCHAWDRCQGRLSDCETTMSYSGSVSNSQWWTCWLWTGKGVTRAAWWKPLMASRHYQGHEGGTWHVSARAIPVHLEVSGWMLFYVDSCGWHFGGWQTWFCDEQISELPSKQVWGLNTADGKSWRWGELS